MVLTFFCTGYLLLNSLKITLAKKLFNHETVCTYIESTATFSL
jgi:hypothetical protein